MKLIDYANLLIIKRLYSKRQLNKRFIDLSQIKNIGLIIDIDSVAISEVYKVLKLLESENLDGKMLYLTRSKDIQISSYKVIKRKILGISIIKGEDLEEYRQNDFDVILVFLKGDVYALLMAAIGLNAKLTVGSDPSYSEFFDFTIKAKKTTLVDFVKQTFKYLKTIKPK